MLAVADAVQFSDLTFGVDLPDAECGF